MEQNNNQSQQNNQEQSTHVKPSFFQAQEEELRKQIAGKGTSPLYGDRFKQQQQQSIDPAILHEPEVLGSIKHALGVFQDELENKGYTPLTVNSYSSAVNRFVDFLEEGEVIPDFDNKPTH
jgi:hypothetical protein